MKQPLPDEFGSFYQRYIDAIKEDVLTELREQPTTLKNLLKPVAAKADYAYADGKWTLKELLGHIIDTERIMAYRLLRIARNDATPLPGFDQDEYVKHSGHSKLDFETMLEEFETVRKSNLFLIQSLTEEQLNNRGSANNYPLSARALLFIIAGHLKHHIGVIKERYLTS